VRLVEEVGKKVDEIRKLPDSGRRKKKKKKKKKKRGLIVAILKERIEWK
jgi:hypothetical protein